MSYKFWAPTPLPANWSDVTGLRFRTYSVYSGSADSPEPASLVSGSLTTTSGSSTEISASSIATTTTYVWRGYFKPDTTASTWEFKLTSGDGSYLWIDTDAQVPVANLATGSATIDNSGLHSAQSVTSSNLSLDSEYHYAAALIAGNHTGSGEVTLEWRVGGGAWESSGTNYLSYDSRYVDGFGADSYVASHTPLWLGVGRDGRVMYSSDAISWSEYDSPSGTTADYWDISFGKDGSSNDQWIIATNTTTELRKSSDPTTSNSWSTVDFTGSENTRAIEYGANGTWIAATGDDVHRSTDGGTTWTKITSGTSGAGLMLCIATDGAGTWVIGGATNAIKSYDDGLNWYNTFTGKRANGIEYNNGVWFFASHTTTSYRATSIAQSDTTDTWSAVTGISKQLWAICHISGNTWMTGGFNNAAPLISTDNCASWSAVTSTAVGQVMGLASDGTTIVVSGKGKKIQTSTDNGTTWTLRHTSTQEVLVVEYNKVKPF